MESQEKSPDGKNRTLEAQYRISSLLSARYRKWLYNGLKDTIDTDEKERLRNPQVMHMRPDDITPAFSYYVPFMMYESIERQEQTAAEMKGYLVSLHSISDKMNRQIEKLHRHSVWMIILTVVIAAFTIALGYYACRLDAFIQHLPMTMPIN